MVTGLLNNFSRFPQSLHQHSALHVQPSLKHSQQFLRQRVFMQVHLRTTGGSESAQVEVERLEVLSSLVSSTSYEGGAGWQSQLRDPFLKYWGQEPRRSSRSGSSQGSSRPSIIIMICSSSTCGCAYSISILFNSNYHGKKLPTIKRSVSLTTTIPFNHTYRLLHNRTRLKEKKDDLVKNEVNQQHNHLISRLT